MSRSRLGVVLPAWCKKGVLWAIYKVALFYAGLCVVKFALFSICYVVIYIYLRARIFKCCSGL